MSLNSFPKEINILGIPYKIEYCNIPSNVDIHRRESMSGQIDFWSKTIRIYSGDRSVESTWHIIWHELLHGIVDVLNIDFKEDSEEDIIDRIALGLNDILIRNKLGFFKKEKKDDKRQKRKKTGKDKKEKSKEKK